MESSNEPVGKPSVRKLRLRYPSVCSVCGCDLGRGAEAWWDGEAKKAWCAVCAGDADPATDLTGTAGASARLKYERLRDRREGKVKARLGNRLGGIALALTDEPQSTRAWSTGSAGEERLAKLLERELPASAVALHDRRIPGSRANIDHIVVAPSGVWVIDAKLYSGKVERRTLGPIWRPEVAVFVRGRNRTNLIEGMGRQVEAVSAAIEADSAAQDVPVIPAVCFVGSDWALFAKPFEINGVLVTWPQNLVRRLSLDGPLPATAVQRIARRIGVCLPPAVAS